MPHHFNLLTLAAFFLGSMSTWALPYPPRGGSCAIQWVDCTKNVPGPLKQALNITDWPAAGGALPQLPPTLKCGRLDVPLDYTKPIANDNKISLGLSLYTPQNPKGTIFYNPGGPGVEAQSFAWTLATNQSQLFAGLEDFEFMMMDTRGTAASSPLNCSLEAFQGIPLGIPSNQSDFDQTKKQSGTFQQSCMDFSSPKGSPKNIGTQEAVQDWESIRIALGKKQINLLGLSYGTYRFAEYVERYPYSIGLAALDAVTIRGKPDVSQVKDEVVADNRMLLRADAYCQFNTSCPFHDQGKGAVPKIFSQLQDQASKGQLVVKQCFEKKEQGSRCKEGTKLTARDVKFFVTMLMRSPNPTSAFDSMFQAMGLALSGDGSGMVIPIAVDQALFTATPLFCPDDNIDDNSAKGWQSILKQTESSDPLKFQNGLTSQGKLSCSGSSVKGRQKKPINAPNFPFLWITADFDLNTPTEWATQNFEQTPKSTLIVRHGDGHGSMQVPGPARDAIIQYMRTGSVSKSSNETLMTVIPPGSKRGAIADPYSLPFGPIQGDGGLIE